MCSGTDIIKLLRNRGVPKVQKQTYIISDVESFEPKHIFDCGQCFRWNKQQDESYTGVFGKNVINVKKEGSKIIFKGITDSET